MNARGVNTRFDWRKAWFSLLFWLLAFGLEKTLEESHLFSIAYPTLYRITHKFRLEDAAPKLKIILVDVSNWTTPDVVAPHPEIPSLYLRKYPGPTDRIALDILVSRLARLNPAAIGIDIDISPAGPALPPPPGQYLFLEKCLAISTRKHNPVPILLGVGRTAFGTLEQRLGAHQYGTMAASVWREEGANLSMPGTLTWYTSAGKREEIHSLSKALAQAGMTRASVNRRDAPWILKTMLRQQEEIQFKDDAGKTRVFGERFLIDYRDFPHLKRKHQGWESASTFIDSSAFHQQETQLLERFQDAIVLVGDVDSTSTSDTAVIPVSEEPVSGIFTHACAVATLLHHPLYKMKLPCEFVIALFGFLISQLVIHLKPFAKLPEWIQVPLELPLAWSITFLMAYLTLHFFHTFPLGLLATLLSSVVEFLLGIGARLKRQS